MCLCCPFMECICITYSLLLPSCLVFGVAREARIKELEDNAKKLKEELQKLTEQRDDVLTRVRIEEEQQMQRLHIVRGWFSRVEIEETAVGELVSHSSQEIDKLCVGGYCSKDCRSSYKFGRDVAKKLQVVKKLMDEGKFEKVTEKVPKAAAVDEKPNELPSLSNEVQP